MAPIVDLLTYKYDTMAIKNYVVVIQSLMNWNYFTVNFTMYVNSLRLSRSFLGSELIAWFPEHLQIVFEDTKLGEK